jgi:hypothetical protein
MSKNWPSYGQICEIYYIINNSLNTASFKTKLSALEPKK